MKKGEPEHILFPLQEGKLMMNSEPVELLKKADTSKRITVSVHPLNKPEEPERLHIDKQLNYDIVILLETMMSEITFNGYKKHNKRLNTAELSVDTTNTLKTLNRLIRQKITFSGKDKLTHIRNWLCVTSQKTERIIFHIPVFENNKKNKYTIHYRENTGTDVRISLPSLLSCMIESKKQKTTHNYIIYIEENSIKIKRRDRDAFGNKARWRTSPVNKFEILGKLTFIYGVVRD